MVFYDFRANGATHIKKGTQFNRKGTVTMLDNAPLEMEFNINIRAVLIWN
jgi:hypothetical protein